MGACVYACAHMHLQHSPDMILHRRNTLLLLLAKAAQERFSLTGPHTLHLHTATLQASAKCYVTSALDRVPTLFNPKHINFSQRPKFIFPLTIQRPASTDYSAIQL